MFSLLAPVTKPRRKRRKPFPHNLHRVYFEDEAPRIGSGHRLVVLVSYGRKWVRVVELYTRATAKLTRAQWDRITRFSTKLT